MVDRASVNTDRELWRETPGDYYSSSVFVTEAGGIGMNVGGCVVVLPIRDWHRIVSTMDDLQVAIATLARNSAGEHPGVCGKHPERFEMREEHPGLSQRQLRKRNGVARRRPRGSPDD